MTEIGLGHYLTLGAVIFSIGVIGIFLNRKNIIVILMSIELILLVAMVGAIVLTFRKREGVKTQSYLKQISRERSEGVQVLEVETNKGVKIDD